MKISILHTSFLIGDHSDRGDCIKVIDLTKEEEERVNQGAEIIYKKNGISIGDIPKQEEHIETEQEKKYRVISGITLENITNYNLEGITLSDTDIGNLIVDIVFDGNMHAQNALQAKVIGMMLSGQQDPTLMQKVLETQEKINLVRNKFSLPNL